MAQTRTTLSSAVAADHKSIVLASISGLALNMIVQVDAEKMRVTEVPTAATLPVGVLRGVEGTAVLAHVASAGAVFGLPSDFPPAAFLGDRKRDIASYSAAGAIALPTPGNDAVAIINGTAALAMTLANPGKSNDGDKLTIVGNGKAAHTVTVADGIGAAGASYDIATFDANGQNAIELVAANEKWVLLSSMTGTLTAMVPAVA